jgi:hypothetical protein
MDKTIAIHQPNYIPWPGYFYKIFKVDRFVFLDDAQFSNTGLHNYHFIKTRTGPVRIRIPVIQTLGNKIKEVSINNNLDWCEKHINMIKENYGRADHFDEVFSDFTYLIKENHRLLVDLNISIIKYICKKLGIETEFINSSDLNLSSTKEDRIIEICSELGCKVYYSGTGARAYQNEQYFASKGIQLKYLEYRVLQYKQQFSGFQSNASIVDFLANCGYNWDMIVNHQVTL